MCVFCLLCYLDCLPTSSSSFPVVHKKEVSLPLFLVERGNRNNLMSKRSPDWSPDLKRCKLVLFSQGCTLMLTSALPFHQFKTLPITFPWHISHPSLPLAPLIPTNAEIRRFTGLPTSFLSKNILLFAFHTHTYTQTPIILVLPRLNFTRWLLWRDQPCGAEKLALKEN